MVWEKLRFLTGTFVYAFVGAVFAAQEVPQTMTFDGRAFGNSEATVPMLDTISTKIQILTPAQDCVLYEETQSIDTRPTNGYFTIQIGSAISDPKRTGYDSNLAMNKIFANSTTSVAGKKVSDGSACTYNPASGDKRYVRLQMTPAADGVTRSISPNMPLDSVPNSMVAETIQGLAPADLVRVNTTGSTVLSQANAENIFSSTNYPNLVNLLSVAPTSYVRTGTNGSATLPSVSGNPATGLTAGQIWYDSVANVIKYYDGTTKTLGTSSGLSSVGLTLPAMFTVTGSPLTANGSIAATLANQNANLVFAGPASGMAAAPTFRAIAAADLPTTGTAGMYQNGGNSFGAAATLGTNDANTFAVKTNNIARMSFDTSGNVSMGTGFLNITTPTSGNIEVLKLGNSNAGGNAAALGFYVNSAKQSEIYSFDNNLTFNLATASGTMLWRSNGVTKMAMDTDGNLGIGTTLPSVPLEVNKSVSSGITNALFIKNGATQSLNNGVRLSFGNDNSSTAAIPNSYIQSVTTTGAGVNPTSLQFGLWNGSASVEAFRIQPNGNVGVGTAVPAVTLDVAGGAAIGKTGAATSTAAITNVATTLLGMDTSNYPAAGYLMLENEIVSYTGVSGTDFTGLTRGRFGTTAAAHGTINPYSIPFLVKGINTAPVMLATSQGSVGIGTATPATALDVVTTTAGGGINIRNTGAGSYARLSLLNDQNSQSRSLELDYVGSALGFTPYFNSRRGEQGVIGTIGNYPLSLVSGNTMRMTLDGNGNVGVGTSLPHNTFSVSPVLYASSLVQQASQSGNTVTGVGTNFTAALIGSELVYANGVSGGTITAVGSTTSLTVSTTQTVGSNFFTVNKYGLEVTSSGNVGVGTTSPSAALDVATTGANSAIIVPRDSTANRPTGVEGMIRYNTTTTNFEGYQGSSWKRLPASNDVTCSSASQTGVAGTGAVCIRTTDGKTCIQSVGAGTWSCNTPTGWTGDGAWQCTISYSTGYIAVCIRVDDGHTCYSVPGGGSWTCSTPTTWGF